MKGSKSDGKLGKAGRGAYRGARAPAPGHGSVFEEGRLEQRLRPPRPPRRTTTSASHRGAVPRWGERISAGSLDVSRNPPACPGGLRAYPQRSEQVERAKLSCKVVKQSPVWSGLSALSMEGCTRADDYVTNTLLLFLLPQKPPPHLPHPPRSNCCMCVCTHGFCFLTLSLPVFDCAHKAAPPPPMT